MRTTNKLTFDLIIAEPGASVRTLAVNPKYSGLRLKWQRDNERIFHRKSLNGDVEFWGEDFAIMHRCSLRTKFTLVVNAKGRGEVVRIDFRKTDCEWDVNHGICKLSPKLTDTYKALTDHADDEFNLVRLGLDRKSLSVYKYPIIQTYIYGDDRVAVFGFVSGAGRAVSCGVSNNIDDLVAMKFFTSYSITFAVNATINDSKALFASASDSPSSPSVTQQIWKAVSSNSNYEIWLRNMIQPLDENVYWWFELRDTSGRLVDRYPAGSYITGVRNVLETKRIGFYWGGNSMECSVRVWAAGSRLLSDLSNGLSAIGNNDIASFGYRYCKSLKIDKRIVATTRTSETDKGYGRVENTSIYYDTPDDDNNYIPLYMDSWTGGCSVWARERVVTYNEREQFKRNYIVSDFYTLTDSIRAVVQQIEPTLQFDEGDSAFLYDEQNPVSGYTQGKLYISQKSNILNLGYDYPAWLAPITFKKIETMLKNALGCYWDIYEDGDGVRHLRIEHRSFYENGGTYQSAQHGNKVDLSMIADGATALPFSYRTNRWEWDTDGGGLYTTATRYEYGWMDNQTALFDGETIIVPEEYRLFSDEKKEDCKVDWFSSDIDFLYTVPEECSSNGFVLCMEDYNNEGHVITGDPYHGTEKYEGQNYPLSFDYLQPTFLTYGYSSQVVDINGNLVQVPSVAKMRTAEVEFRLRHGEWLQPGGVVATEAGRGIVDEMEYDLSSDWWTAKLRYDNE